jgi:predicted dinucleotide-binding enzyme
MSELPTIGVLGGTGDLGSALLRRWSQAGYPVVIGSRSWGAAEAARLPNAARVRGEDNLNASRITDIIASPACPHRKANRVEHG